MGSITGSGRSPGGGHDNPLWHSCLENPMDRGAWWATVHGVTKSQTGLILPLYFLSLVKCYRFSAFPADEMFPMEVMNIF